jgi:hypothetical protein
MRSRGRLLFIIVLALLGIVFASAYVIGASITFDRDVVSPPQPNHYYYLRIEASRGRLDCYFVRDVSGMAMGRSGYPATVSGWHLYPEHIFTRPTSIDTFGIYECSAHTVARRLGLFIYEISFPIWPVAAICWLPLVMRLRKTLQQRDTVGFPIDAAPRPSANVDSV